MGCGPEYLVRRDVELGSVGGSQFLLVDTGAPSVGLSTLPRLFIFNYTPYSRRLAGKMRRCLRNGSRAVLSTMEQKKMDHNFPFPLPFPFQTHPVALFDKAEWGNEHKNSALAGQ
jgi:hypothetical protein